MDLGFSAQIAIIPLEFTGTALMKKKNHIASVLIKFVPPSEARYRTIGDWFFTFPGDLTIQIADTGNWIYNLLVAIHELIEVFLCQIAGVTEKQVDRFDLAHQADEDPGSHPKAPYHDQHMIAMGVEMILSAKAGVKWRKYEDALDRVYFKIPKRKKPL
jgi:hypothetical protein